MKAYTTIQFYRQHLPRCNLDELCSLLSDCENHDFEKHTEFNKLVIELIKTEIRKKVAA